MPAVAVTSALEAYSYIVALRGLSVGCYMEVCCGVTAYRGVSTSTLLRIGKLLRAGTHDPSLASPWRCNPPSDKTSVTWLRKVSDSSVTALS